MSINDETLIKVTTDGWRNCVKLLSDSGLYNFPDKII